MRVTLQSYIGNETCIGIGGERGPALS